MTVFYFTASGNSLAAAKKIGGELVSVPQALKNEHYEFADTVIGFVFPVYCCSVPKIIREFMSRARLQADYFFAVATYGNGLGRGGDGGALLEFADLAQTAGYQFHYLNSILMVDNFIDNFDINKEIARIPAKKIDENLTAIVADIKAGKSYIKDPGLFGKMLTGLCKGLVKKQDQGLTAQSFMVSEACSGCGICAQVCPYGNITLQNQKPAFGTNCLSCYACLHNCPQLALHKKNEKSAVRWRHPEVGLNEIIAANDNNNVKNHC